MAKIPIFFAIGWDLWSKKKVNYLSCIEGKRGGKDIHWSAQNAALFVDLTYNIFYQKHALFKYIACSGF